MLTPQEVSEHAFAKASFGGYNMGMVDEFLDVLTADYTTLYKENATLKAKMKVLVDKVEEYRSTEDAMRRALLNAQKMADEMIAQAERKRDGLLKDAETTARTRVEQLRQEINNEELRLRSAQEATAGYVAHVEELCRRQVEFLGGLSGLTAAPVKGDQVSTAAQEIEASVEKLVTQPPEDSLPAEAEEAESAPEGSLYAELQEMIAQGGGEEAEEPTRRIDFDHLQFGKDYEIR